MAVGTWQDPDHETQTGTALKTRYDNAHAVAKRIIDGFAPHEASPADLTVVLDAGAVWDGTTLTEVAEQTTPAIALPAVDQRIDRVVRDRGTGAVSVVAGVEDPAPVPPAIPAGKEPIARVGPLLPTTTAVTNALIEDERAGLTPQPVPDPAAGPAFGLLRRNSAGAYRLMDPISATPEKNVVDNPSFFLQWMQNPSNPGQIVGGEFWHNRWILLSADAGTIDCGLSGDFYDGYGTFERIGAGGRLGVMQYIEEDFTDRLVNSPGTRMSLSFQIRSNAGVSNIRAYLLRYTGGGIPDLAATISSWNAAGADPTFNNWAIVAGTGNVPVSGLTTQVKLEDVSSFNVAGGVAVLIMTDDDAVADGGGFDVRKVMLEPGPVATDWNPRPLQTEQLRCMRYAYWLYGIQLKGFVKNSTTVRVAAQLPVQLAGFVTATLIGGNMFYQGTSVSPTGPTLNVISQQPAENGTSQFMFEITGYSGLSTGQGVIGTNQSAILLTSEY